MSGRSSTLWNPANVVTCLRVAGVPLWLFVAELSGDGGRVTPVATLALFVILSLTDTLDGYLARSRSEVTDFGKFLDPIADKLVVVVALCFLLERHEVSAWVVLVIVAREFLVSGLRMVVASKGVVVAASALGKWKTATTMISIVGLLLARALTGTSASSAVQTGSQLLMWFAVALTAWSGLDYFVKCWPVLMGEEDER